MIDFYALENNNREDLIAYGFKIFEIEDEYVGLCEASDFDENGFNKELYNTRRQKDIDWFRLLDLDNWFKTQYREYNEMLTRRKELGIEDTIVDEFRNKTYHNLIELYEEAEVVASEIRELRESLKPDTNQLTNNNQSVIMEVEN